jgi:NAD(P)-dependent dehydrogenase (short-subunit alcohol dehydrogenase family)
MDTSLKLSLTDVEPLFTLPRASSVLPTPTFSLAGKKAFVTGASRGIGRACALLLADAGADVAVGSSPAGEHLARDVCDEIRARGRHTRSYCFDLGARREVERMCNLMNEDFHGIDVLVNNAGVTEDRSFRRMDRVAWDRVIDTNLNAVFDVTRLFIDGMATRGWGRVINVSSIVGQIGNFGQANYAAAKAGLIGFTKTLAREYASRGVTVNAVAPGFIQTRMLDGVPEKSLDAVLRSTPIGRLGTPADVAASVLYLASPAASFVTGHVLDVNGGMAM